MSEVIDVRGRHLLRLADFTSAEILYLLDLAAELKAAKRWPRSEIVDLARSIANETGAKITMTEVTEDSSLRPRWCSTRQRTVCTRSRRSWSLPWPVDDARGRRAWRKRTASTR